MPTLAAPFHITEFDSQRPHRTIDEILQQARRNVTQACAESFDEDIAQLGHAQCHDRVICQRTVGRAAAQSRQVDEALGRILFLLAGVGQSGGGRR